LPSLLVRALAWVWTHRVLDDRTRSYVMWLLNAKVTAGVTAVIHNQRGEVLLLEHAFRRRYPWALPGGWMGRAEAPEAAIVREVKEETGLDIRVEALLAVRTFFRPRLDIVYRCVVEGGTIRGSPETLSWQWCLPGAYPPDTDPYSIELVERAAGARSQP
jgi:ADP-ribose pyrophosphatase YjhB (NUDIX family)